MGCSGISSLLSPWSNRLQPHAVHSDRDDGYEKVKTISELELCRATAGRGRSQPHIPLLLPPGYVHSPDKQGLVSNPCSLREKTPQIRLTFPKGQMLPNPTCGQSRQERFPQRMRMFPFSVTALPLHPLLPGLQPQWEHNAQLHRSVQCVEHGPSPTGLKLQH